MRRSDGGFSRFESLVLVVALAAASGCLVPATQAARVAADSAADRAQLRTHYVWLQQHKAKRGGLPIVGGHAFVMSTWMSKVFEHTPENLDRFFSPGVREDDPDYRAAREVLAAGEDPWPDLSSVNTTDTHYVGRGQMHLRTAEADRSEAWMANDNEGVWAFPDGSLNVLYAAGAVRCYSHEDLRARFGVGELDPDEPVRTYGPNSPIPDCQKLDN